MKKRLSIWKNLFSSPSAFEKEYRMGRELGKGAFSVVKLATSTKTHEEVAVKVVSRKKMTKEDEKALQLEVKILQELASNTAIVHLIAYFEEPKQHYLVLECMSGGELFNRIVQREHYTEKDAIATVKVVAEVLEFCHSAGVAHRDLKPENILLKDASPDAAVKLADFGFARHVRDGCTTACGTPGYVAPEIITGKVYNTQCDVWSLGVILYILLCGFPPFYAKNRQDLFRAIRHAKYQFESPYWDGVTESAKDLINKMLVVDPNKRLTAEQVLQHPWLKDPASPKELNKQALRIFNARRHMRAAFKGAIVAGRIQDLVNDLKVMKSERKLKQQS